MPEIISFVCDETRSRFAIAELSLQVIPGLVKREVVGALTGAKMTSVAEADRDEAGKEATDAGHAGCLGEKACQLALQVEDEA